MQINTLINYLRLRLNNISFDELLNNLESLEGVVVCRVSGKQIDDDVIDIEIQTVDRIDYIVTLRRIVNYYPIPSTYITINKTITMADNVEVYYAYTNYICSDIIKDSNGNYILAQPICVGDIDTQALAEVVTHTGMLDLINSIVNTISDNSIKVDVLGTIKDFYDVQAVE